MVEFRLGDRVRYTNGLMRKFKPSSPYSRKVWEPRDFDSSHPKHKGDGIVVGIRTLANGRIEYGYPDEPTTFHADERFQAVLIAHSLRARPVLVRVEDVELIEDPSLPNDGDNS